MYIYKHTCVCVCVRVLLVSSKNRLLSTLLQPQPAPHPNGLTSSCHSQRHTTGGPSAFFLFFFLSFGCLDVVVLARSNLAAVVVVFFCFCLLYKKTWQFCVKSKQRESRESKERELESRVKREPFK